MPTTRGRGVPHAPPVPIAPALELAAAVVICPAADAEYRRLVTGTPGDRAGIWLHTPAYCLMVWWFTPGHVEEPHAVYRAFRAIRVWNGASPDCPELRLGFHLDRWQGAGPLWAVPRVHALLAELAAAWVPAYLRYAADAVASGDWNRRGAAIEHALEILALSRHPAYVPPEPAA